jgi:hypothetical protein
MLRRYDAAVSGGKFVHRVSKYLCCEGIGCLGSHLRHFASTGNMSVTLRSEITAYQLCMLDDSMQEGPHAAVSRVALAARTSNVRWWSSTLRLKQNLAMWEANEPLVNCWFDRWKAICQKSSAKRTRGVPAKVQASVACAYVYRTGDSCMELHPEMCKSVLGQSVTVTRKTLDTVADIHRDYINKVFRSGCSYTWPEECSIDRVAELTGDSAGQSTREVTCGLQVLDMSAMTKKHVRTDSLALWRSFRVPASVQHFGFESTTESGQTPKVYFDGNPTVVDLHALADWRVISKSLCQWNVKALAGVSCCELVDKEVIAARTWTVKYHHKGCQCNRLFSLTSLKCSLMFLDLFDIAFDPCVGCSLEELFGILGASVCYIADIAGRRLVIGSVS